MFPKGATDDQLVWRLASSGLRLNTSDLLAGLTALAERGEIRREASRRWLLVRADAAVLRPKHESASRTAAPTDDGRAFYAVTASHQSRIVEAGPPSPAED